MNIPRSNIDRLISNHVSAARGSQKQALKYRRQGDRNVAWGLRMMALAQIHSAHDAAELLGRLPRWERRANRRIAAAQRPHLVTERGTVNLRPAA